MNQIKVAVVSTGVAIATFVANAANAAIDASVGTALTAVQTDAAALQALVIPVVVGVLGLTLVITLIKRFGSKI